MAVLNGDNIICDCSYTDFKVLDGMIIYLPKRSLRLNDDSIVKYHENFLKLVVKKVTIRILNDRIFEFEGGTEGLKKFLRELEIVKANKLASAYSQVAIKGISQYVEKYYAISIPKSSIDYKGDSVIFRTENCDLFFLGPSDPFSYDKNGEPDLDEDEAYSENTLEDILITQATYNVDLSLFIKPVLDALKDGIRRKIESLKEANELVVSIKGIITLHNFQVLMKYDKHDSVLLYPNSGDYAISLKCGGYEWAYWGGPCSYFSSSVIKYDNSYHGPELLGDVVIFNNLIVNECMNLMESPLEFSQYKKYKWNNWYLPIYYLNHRCYFANAVKRQLKSFNEGEWDIYLTKESLDYLSDINNIDFWSCKKDTADLYILISKDIDKKGRYCIVLHPTLKKHADYYIYVYKDKKDLAFCFLTYYFNSSIPNKRQTFFYLRYSFLKSFGIDYWEKR